MEEQSEARRQFAKLMLNGKQVMALLDTGSQVSLVPPYFDVQAPHSKQTHAVNGSKINTRGMALIHVKIMEDCLSHNFVVAEVKTPIIGRDFLIKVKGNIRFDNYLEYSWNNQSHLCPLYLEEPFFHICDLSDEEVCSILVEDLSLSESSPTTTEQPPTIISSLIDQYSEIFNGIGSTNLIEHSIELKSDTVVNIKPYPIPHAYRDEVRSMIQDMLTQDIIEESCSEWSSPLVVVKKKEGSIRLAVDFRKLNSISKQDAFPTPSINEIINGLNNAKIFSKLDFKSGYYQVPLRASDRPKTAFKIDNKLYQFKRMPFGLCTAMQTFMRLISKIFQFEFVKAYVDDIVIFSSTIDQHVKHLQHVFEAIRQAGLTLNTSKCSFAKESIEYLGFIIGNNSIRPSPAKVDCVIKYPVPKNKKELRSFLGLVNSYRNLIPNFADSTWDLYHLLKKDTRFVWKPHHNNQFEKLKRLMSSDPIIRMPDLNRQFILRTDASDKAMAAILQQVDDNGHKYVVEYFSKKFTECQQRYATVEKEATAVKTAIDRWSTYLRGRHFTLETDHRPLVWLRSMASRNNKLARMAIDLSEYDFNVIHIKGVENTDADALSRIEVAAIGFDELASEQEADDHLVAQRSKNPGSFVIYNNLLYFKETSTAPFRLCIPQSRVKEILRLCHDSLNHIGQHKTIDIIYQRFYWPGWRGDVKQFVHKCQCNIKKSQATFPKAPLQPTDIESFTIFERVAIDTMSLNKAKSGNKVIFTLQDYRSKWIEAKATTSATASSFIIWLDEIWARFGKPKEIWADKGSQFESRTFREYCDRNNIILHHTTAYHHQSNGMIERSHKTLWNFIKVMVNSQQDDWDQYLQNALWTYRSTIHLAINKSPFEAMYERPPKIEADHLYPTQVENRSNREGYSQRYQQRMKKHYDERMKSREDHIKIGSMVLINHPTIKSGKCQKLLSSNKGPFKVSKMIGPSTYMVMDSKEQCIKVHRDQMIRTNIKAHRNIQRRGRPPREV